MTDPTTPTDPPGEAAPTPEALATELLNLTHRLQVGILSTGLDPGNDPLALFALTLLGLGLVKALGGDPQIAADRALELLKFLDVDLVQMNRKELNRERP